MTDKVRVINYGPGPVTVETYDPSAKMGGPTKRLEVVYAGGVSDEMLVYDRQQGRIVGGEHAFAEAPSGLVDYGPDNTPTECFCGGGRPRLVKSGSPFGDTYTCQTCGTSVTNTYPGEAWNAMQARLREFFRDTPAKQGSGSDRAYECKRLPGACDWPKCGCDPHANRVIEALNIIAKHENSLKARGG